MSHLPYKIEILLSKGLNIHNKFKKARIPLVSGRNDMSLVEFTSALINHYDDSNFMTGIGLLSTFVRLGYNKSEFVLDNEFEKINKKYEEYKNAIHNIECIMHASNIKPA